MQHVGVACAFVQVVYILGDYFYLKLRLQLGYGQMSRVGLNFIQLFSAEVVKLQHQGWVAVPRIGCCHIFYAVVFPQAVGISESADAALCANAGSGKDCYSFLHKVKVRHVFLWLFILGVSLRVEAQNLVLNGGFELISSCDVNYGDIEMAEGWSNFYHGNNPTPDVFNVCSFQNEVSVPENTAGYQLPQSGMGYSGFLPVLTVESILGTINDPLQKDSVYYVSFSLSLGDRFKEAMRNIGLVFLDNMNTIPSDSFYTIQPDLIETNWVTDKVGWHLIDTVYVADGNETHLAIGYFPNENIYETLPGQGGDRNGTYYYVDDVQVIPYSIWLGASELAVEKEALSVYPNPATNLVNLKVRHNSVGMTVSVFDVLGKEMLLHGDCLGSANLAMTGGCSFDVSAWPAGMYFLTLTNEEGNRYTERFVVSSSNK